TEADSFAYTVSGGIAGLDLYFQGKKIASLDQAGFESQLLSESFTYAYDKGQNQLKLSLGGQDAMSLAMATPAKKGLPQGGFKWMDVPRGLLGMLFVVGFCYMLSKNRKAIDWRLVGTGLAMQLGIALLVLKAPFVKGGFKAIAGFFIKLLSFTEAGTSFVFGQDLGTSAGTVGMVFGIHVLSIIIFFSAITSLLYYFGILQWVVKGFAWVMSKTMRLSGAESMAAAGNIFLGQTEAPLLVKPYLEGMTKSEILCLMGGGMAIIAGSVFGAYVAFLGGDDPVQQQLFATHLLTASIMAAPGAIVAAKILLPETEEVDRELNIPKERLGDNALDAIAIGGTEGMKLAVNVGVMLLVFVALIKGVNWFMGDFIGDLTGLNAVIAEATDGSYNELSLQYVFGMILAPVAWLLGVAS
ncbi:MAG: hypothetical protein KAG66_24835, partial [Methylococcales bacterium]|nr:hypothetical protein [Methylococcales bacterium]